MKIKIKYEKMKSFIECLALLFLLVGMVFFVVCVIMIEIWKQIGLIIISLSLILALILNGILCALKNCENKAKKNALLGLSIDDVKHRIYVDDEYLLKLEIKVAHIPFDSIYDVTYFGETSEIKMERLRKKEFEEKIGIGATHFVTKKTTLKLFIDKDLEFSYSFINLRFIRIEVQNLIPAYMLQGFEQNISTYDILDTPPFNDEEIQDIKSAFVMSVAMKNLNKHNEEEQSWLYKK